MWCRPDGGGGGASVWLGCGGGGASVCAMQTPAARVAAHNAVMQPRSRCPRSGLFVFIELIMLPSHFLVTMLRDLG